MNAPVALIRRLFFAVFWGGFGVLGEVASIRSEGSIRCASKSWTQKQRKTGVRGPGFGTAGGARQHPRAPTAHVMHTPTAYVSFLLCFLSLCICTQSVAWPAFEGLLTNA